MREKGEVRSPHSWPVAEIWGVRDGGMLVVMLWARLVRMDGVG